MSCLLVGEGNFSHSVKLAETTTDFVATCLESLNPDCEETKMNVELLRLKGIEVCFDVDARKLNNLGSMMMKRGRFRRIVFNFPHTGGKMRIDRNRELLKDFFIACGRVLDLENGVVEVALCRGQGGTPVDETRAQHNDTWKVCEMAAYGGFVLVDVKPFEANYQNAGYRGLSKSFNASEALLHIFSFSGQPPSLQRIRDDTKLEGTCSGLESKNMHRPRDVRFPTEYKVHFSFWVDESTKFVEESLKRTIENHFSDIDVTIEQQVDKFSRDGETSWCFELKLSSKSYALSRTDGLTRFVQILAELLKLELPSARPRL